MAKWKLYWVTGFEGGLEDCFIIAKNSRSAARIHEEQEGMDAGDATAERILDVPGDHVAAAIAHHRSWLRKQDPSRADDPDVHCWPWYAYERDLRALGAILNNHADTREVVIGRRSFFPNTLEEVLAQHRKNPNPTKH